MLTRAWFVNLKFRRCGGSNSAPLLTFHPQLPITNNQFPITHWYTVKQHPQLRTVNIHFSGDVKGHTCLFDLKVENAVSIKTEIVRGSFGHSNLKLLPLYSLVKIPIKKRWQSY
jgi:hypothetical protein